MRRSGIIGATVTTRTPRPTPRTIAELALAGTTFIWGSTFVLVKLGLAELPPLLFNALRFTLAAALLLPWALRPLARVAETGGRAGLARLLADGAWLAVLIVLGFGLQTAGLKYTTASNSAFITGMMVLFTPLLQLALHGRRPQPENVVGIAIVLVGLALLTAPSGRMSLGDLLTLACAAVFALYIVQIDTTSRRHDLTALTFVQIAGAAALDWLAAFALEPLALRVSAGSIAILIYLALFATIVTTYVMTRYQRDTTPTRAAIIYTVEPVWAAALGYWVLQERLGPSGLLGAALIIAGILISELWGKRVR
jgi:drug/metabolite transporter (DMT)-like permease